MEVSALTRKDSHEFPQTRTCSCGHSYGSKCKKLKGSEAWPRTLEFFMYYEMCLINGCVFRYMDMLEYNVMAKGRRWQKAIADKAVATATVRTLRQSHRLFEFSQHPEGDYGRTYRCGKMSSHILIKSIHRRYLV